MTDETFVTYVPWSGSNEPDISPELALVDPELAERARSQLLPPDDTLSRVQYLIATSRMASLAQRLPEPEPRRIATTTSMRRARTRHRRSAILRRGAAAGVLATALLLGVRVDLSGSPAGADPIGVDVPIVDSVPSAPVGPNRDGKSPPRRTSSTGVSQRFAWAPVAGSSGYHVELFRGASKAFETDTQGPFVTVPTSWRLAGRVHTLEPGEYRWYVWPLISGRRSARATVQARLKVPAS